MTVTTKTVQDPSVAWARSLWDRLKDAFAQTEKSIAELIAARAWEPLGYSTFAEAWKAEMKDVELASQLRPHIVYQLFDEGMTPEEVAANVKGVGQDGAKALKSNKDNGVPANKATRSSSDTRVKVAATRAKAKAPSQLPVDDSKRTITLSVDAAEYDQWYSVAKVLHKSVEAVARPAALKAIRAEFQRLAR